MYRNGLLRVGVVVRAVVAVGIVTRDLGGLRSFLFVLTMEQLMDAVCGLLLLLSL